jgi:hypothetical protein
MEYTTERIFEVLQTPLTLVEDEAQKRSFERYVAAARFPLERAVFDLLAAFTEDVDQQVADHYRVRLAYRAGALDLQVEPAEPRGPAATPADAEFFAVDGEMEKVTIRIPAGLKDLITQDAAEAGVSVNTWFIRVLVHALRSSLRGVDEPEHRQEHRHRHQRRERGSRLSGWIGGDE